MFLDLSSRLSLPSASDAVTNGVFISIEDTFPSDGSFLLFHFVSSFLKKPGAKVIFVVLNNAPIHYRTVGAKLSVNIGRAEAEQKLHFVEISDCVENLVRASEILEKLLQKIDEICPNFDENTLLIVDSVSAFLDLGCCQTEILKFLAVCLEKVSFGKSTLLLLVNKDENNTDTFSDYDSLAISFAHMADVRLLTKPVGTGFSKDVSGELTISKRFPGAQTLSEISRLHYRLGERSVQFFEPGMTNPLL